LNRKIQQTLPGAGETVEPKSYKIHKMIFHRTSKCTSLSYPWLAIKTPTVATQNEHRKIRKAPAGIFQVENFSS